MSKLLLNKDTEALANIGSKSIDIASATTTDLSTATGEFVHITGTTTITGLGTANAGVSRTVVFDGVLTLTHNATSLILPSGADIITSAGDTAVFVSEGSGNWKCVDYTRADGTALVSGGGANSTLLHTFNSSNVAGVETRYTGFTVDAPISSADDFGIPMPAGTLKNMRIYLKSGAGGSGIQVVLLKNGTDTVLDQTVNSTTVVTDADSVTFADGDILSIKLVPLNYGKTWYMGITVEFEPS